MCQQPYHLHIRRIDPTRNMARFYELSISTTLFGNVSLTRSWGRIGTRGQSRVHLCETEQQAVVLFLDLLKRKRKRGYRSRLSTDCDSDGQPHAAVSS
ncbi:WGR domain-containing protein [Neorhizobium sp. T786]|uniref:WGR domain-containing protein n=1 Tax=Pseudorhizobium xiangyangii TaxID=2883104 RepID=UPI001CFFCB0F|nr:WGR domain-containing protein [Neorhizobium xiangyangii]MCB5205574.1 WGR domain-containing protein [Neorhizobium xiangyangii]